MLTLRLLGLPCESWPHYGEVFHAMIAHPEDSPEYASALASDPGDDRGAAGRSPPNAAITRATTCSRRWSATPVEGDRLLDDDELISVLWNLVGGGLDTTTSLTSLSLYYLDGPPGVRDRLIAEPGLLSTATEEFLRYFSVNETLTAHGDARRRARRPAAQGGDPLLSAGCRPTGTRPSSSAPTRWCSTAPPTPTSRSASGRAGASGCTWRGRCSRSWPRRCCTRSPTTRSTGRHPLLPGQPGAVRHGAHAGDVHPGPGVGVERPF